MPSMVASTASRIRFTTTSKRYNAFVAGPKGSEDIVSGALVVLSGPGMYTISVTDRALGSFSVTLEDTVSPPYAHPKKVEAHDDEHIRLSIEVNERR